MSRYFAALAAITLILPAAPAAPVSQEGGKGAAFPYTAKSPIVVCLNGYERARERFSKLVEAALPNEAPKLIKRFDEVLEKVLHERKLTAVRKDARLFVALNDLGGILENDQPPLAVLVPVTSYKEFRQTFLTVEELKSIDQGKDGVDTIKTAAFGEEMPAYLVDLKDYVAVTTDKATAGVYAGKYARASADQLGPELAESFLKADVGIYVNMDAVNEQFGDQIRGIKGLIDFGIQQAAQQGTLPGFSAKQMDALKTLLKGAFQAAEDCRAVVFAAEFRPDGLALRLQARFADDSASAKLISLEKPTALAEIGQLPNGLGVYGGVRFGRTISELLRDIGQDLSTTAEDVQGARLIEGHRKDLHASGHQGDISATMAPGVSITVSNYSDPAKAVRALTKTYKAVAAGGRVNSVILKAAPRVNDEAEKLGSFTFAEVQLRYDFDATVADLPDPVKEATLQSLTRSLTPETRMWIGTDGKVVLSVTAKEWKDAKDLLERYRDAKRSVGADAAFKLTRSQLPAEANVVVIAETGSAIHTMMDSLRATGEALPGFPRIPALKPAKGEPTYVGMAVVLRGETASVTAFVPTSALAAGGKILEPLFKNIE
jgi:hypothetical protein